MRRLFLPLLLVFTLPTIVLADFDHSCSDRRLENFKKDRRELFLTQHLGMAAVALPRAVQVLYHYAKYKDYISPARVARLSKWTPFLYPLDVAVSAAGLFTMIGNEPTVRKIFFNLLLTHAIAEAEQNQIGFVTRELTLYLNHILYPEFPPSAVFKPVKVDGKKFRKEFVFPSRAHVFTENEVNFILVALINEGSVCRPLNPTPKFWTRKILRTYLQQRI